MASWNDIIVIHYAHQNKQALIVWTHSVQKMSTHSFEIMMKCCRKSTQKSNRGRKAMQSTILTSPKNISALKSQRRKNDDQKTTMAPTVKKKAARPKPSSSSSEKDDFCIICMKTMPRKLSCSNSIECNKCKRAVQLKCSNMQTGFFTCINCDSDLDASDDEL